MAVLKEISPVKAVNRGIGSLGDFLVKELNRGCFFGARARGFHDTYLGISHACDPFGVGGYEAGLRMTAVKQTPSIYA